MIELSYKNVVHRSAILDIKEKNTLAESFFSLKPFDKFDEHIIIQDDVKVTIGLGTLKISFTAKIKERSKEIISLYCPLSISTINNRKSNRNEIHNAKTEDNDILMYQRGIYYNVIFRLQDYSNKGLGGIIKTKMSFAPCVGTKLSGKIIINNTLLEIEGLISRVKHLSDNLFEIGIEKKDLVTKRNHHTKKDRVFTRIKTNHNLVLINILNNEKKFNIKLTDISVLGFSIQHENNKYDGIYFSPGSFFYIENTNLISELYYNDKEVIRFKIVQGNNKDRLDWFHKFSKDVESKMTYSSFSSNSLLEVFCESGALSSEYLLLNRDKSNKYIEFFNKEESTKFWLHKWVSVSEHGSPTGHICSIKMANNMWLIGDIVGAQDKEQRMPKSMRHSFLKTFSEWSLSASPCPIHMIMWLDGHPYWKEYEKYINSEKSSEYILEQTSLSYSRLEECIVDEDENQNEFIEEILANDFKLINYILQEAIKMGIQQTLLSFDFSINNFSSYSLQNDFIKNNDVFFRKYFLYKNEEKSLLIILNKFPEGASLNRVIDSIWIFELNKKTYFEDKEWEKVKKSLQVLALKNGLSAPSIRRIYNEKIMRKKLYKNELVTLKCLILNPTFWLEAQKTIL